MPKWKKDLTPKDADGQKISRQDAKEGRKGFFGGGPAAVHARRHKGARDQDRAGRWWFKKNQFRRDLTKVAQYEVLGNEAKGKSVP
jgi:hypothetical protein